MGLPSDAVEHTSDPIFQRVPSDAGVAITRRHTRRASGGADRAQQSVLESGRRTRIIAYASVEQGLVHASNTVGGVEARRAIALAVQALPALQHSRKICALRVGPDWASRVAIRSIEKLGNLASRTDGVSSIQFTSNAAVSCAGLTDSGGVVGDGGIGASPNALKAEEEETCGAS